ncbi:MAG: hypothetical protein KTR31_11730 [Myxococcales bacterium]|nr:hypothetical protein [Myxococcales bacterium]
MSKRTRAALVAMFCTHCTNGDLDPNNRVTDLAPPTADTGDTSPVTDTGPSTADTGTASGSVTLIPALDGPMALGTSTPWLAPSFLATFDENTWTVHTPLADGHAPLEIPAGPTGRFAVASVCSTDGGAEVRLFLGSTVDGSQVQLRGCPGPVGTKRVASTLTVDDSLYDGQPPGNGTCGVVGFGGAVWFASCNPVSSIQLQTLVGGPTQLFAQRYDAKGRTDRVALQGPIDVPAQGYPVTLDFDGGNAAAPVYLDVVSTLDSVSASLVTPWSQLWLPQHPDDPGIPLVPPAIVPTGSRYLASGLRTDLKLLLTERDTLVFDDPSTPITMGDDFGSERPDLQLKQNGDGTTSVSLTAASDWSVATLSAFSQDPEQSRWSVAVSRSFPGPTSQWLLPAPDELPGLLDWAQTELGSQVEIDDLSFPSKGFWSWSVRHSRGAAATPFEIWRSTFFVDHLADGTRIVDVTQFGSLP